MWEVHAHGFQFSSSPSFFRQPEKRKTHDDESRQTQNRDAVSGRVRRFGDRNRHGLRGGVAAADYRAGRAVRHFWQLGGRGVRCGGGAAVFRWGSAGQFYVLAYVHGAGFFAVGHGTRHVAARSVAAEKVWDDYRGYYGRLWLESADGQNDLVLEENFLPYKDSLHRLDDIQSHIARTTGFAKRPVINTEIRAPEETAADLSKLHAPKPEILPAWRQAVNLAAAGLWTGLAVWLLRLAADWQSGGLPKPLYFGAGLLALGLLAVAVSEVRSVFRARRVGKTRQTVGRQPSEIKAALEAARQAGHETQPHLPERSALRSEGKTEFAVYSLAALLSRIPFLLLVLLILLGGFEFSQKWLFWLVVLLFAGWRLAYHWHTLHKARYNAQEDTLTVYRLRRFKWQPEKHCVLSAFCGIYCREKYSSMGVREGEIWLAGKEGGNDVRLLKADFLLRDNRQAALATAKKIARTTGLPLLEYIEPAERIA